MSVLETFPLYIDLLYIFTFSAQMPARMDTISVFFYLKCLAAHYTIFNYCFVFVSTATSFPDGHFDMSALDRLEKVAGISIFDKLGPKFLEMASTLDIDERILSNLRIENNPVERSKDVMKVWVSGESSLPSTWQVLLEKLQAVERELAEEMKHFFKGTPVTSLPLPLVSLCMCWIHIGAQCLSFSHLF